MDGISQLIGIGSHVVERNKASDEFTIEKIMSFVDCPQAPKCIVVGILAETKRPIRPQGCSLPVVVVVSEAVHLFEVARSILELGLASELALLASQLFFLGSGMLNAKLLFLAVGSQQGALLPVGAATLPRRPFFFSLAPLRLLLFLLAPRPW